MALSQDDRIAISKKIVNIPLENQTADTTKAQLAAVKAEAEAQDNANKAIIGERNTLINAYQLEFNRYDGNLRTTLSEQDFQDSVGRIKGNAFFPADTDVTTLPGIPTGVWTNLTAYSQTKVIGKKSDGTYDSTQYEQELIDAVNDAIAAVEAFDVVEQSTGEQCIEGTCSLPIYDNQIDCVDNAGVWTPGIVINTYQDMQDAGQALIDAVQAWEDFLNGTKAVVPTTDTNGTRAAQNTASIADIDNAISEIDSWQAFPDYDTGHGQVTCIGFYAVDVNTLNQTKFRADSLQILKDEITAREAFITNRISELETNLGSVTQDYSNGEVSAATGLYGARYRFIDMRVNALSGSLAKLKGIENGEAAQDAMKSANDNAAAAYDSLMKATAFRAPGTNTNSIHVLDPSAFSVSDSVYIISDTQQEISATITDIDNNRIVLDTKIPEKYRTSEFARLYKVL